MRIPGRFSMLALLVVLAAVPVHAQDAAALFHAQHAEVCVKRERWRPSPEELEKKLQAHKGWLDKRGWENPAIRGRAVLCNAVLFTALLPGADLRLANLHGADLRLANLQGAHLDEAQLEGVNLNSANLQGAYLRGADLQGAGLSGANLQGASLSGADLSQANLMGAHLNDAKLFGTNLEGARLTRASLFSAWYEPATAPAAGYLTRLKGLTTLRFGPAEGSGLVLLRAQLAEAGLRDLERQATYALERLTIHHKLQAWREQPLSSLGVGLEGALRLIAFECPVAYGLSPGRALRILLWSIGGFALIYLIPLASNGPAGIHRVWPEGRLEARSSTVELVGRPKVERLRPRGWWGLKRVPHALQFSLLSAFHLGFREINVGSWIARVQAHEYTLRGTGWVRVVAGLQSLLSVYLLALWALTYFGRPFG